MKDIDGAFAVDHDLPELLKYRRQVALRVYSDALDRAFEKLEQLEWEVQSAHPELTRDGDHITAGWYRVIAKRQT